MSGRSLVRFPARGLARRAAGPSMDQFGPFHTDAGWSVVTGQSPTAYERSGRNIRILGFEGNAVVNQCIRIVANLVGSVPLLFYRQDPDGDLAPAREIPGQQVLDRPRVAWSAYRVRETTAAHLLAYGNAFWVLERQRPSGPPVTIRVVHPERLQYVYLDPESQEPAQFDWTDRRGILHRTAWADMVHFKDLDLSPDALFGFPRAAAALLDIATDGEASEYVRQILKNNGSPSLIIGLKGIVSEPQAKQADARWREVMAERGARGGTRFLPGVELVNNVGFNLQELEFPNLRAITREDICAVFGVDPRMAGIASAKGTDGGLSGQQYAEARRRLYLQTGAPLMIAVESELDLSFAPEWGAVRVQFDPDAIAEITESEDETSMRVTRELAAGLLTREEARRKRNLPEEMRPTDILVSTGFRAEYPVAMQFANDVNLRPAVGPAAEPTAPDSLPAATPEAVADASAPSVPSGAARAIVAFRARGLVLSPAQRDVLWRGFDARARAQEATYARTARLQFAVEQGQVHQLLTAHAARADGPDPFLLAAWTQIQQLYGEDGAFHSAWVDRYRGLVAETFRVAGDGVAAGTGVSFNLANPEVQAAIVTRATRLAHYVTAATADQIQSMIAAGRASGMGTAQIADLIDQGVFGGAAATRATRIARTETVGAMNQGEFTAATASGVVRSKEWLTQADGKVRDSHRAMGAAGPVALAHPFPNGLMHPGDQSGAADEVINCRCALLYSDEVAP